MSTDPGEPQPSILVREPVLLIVLVAVLTELGGAVSLVASDHTTHGILVALGAILTGVGGAVARSLVSPTKHPKNAAVAPPDTPKSPS